MITAQDLGYKNGEMHVAEGVYSKIRPAFVSVLPPETIFRKQFDELDALPKNKTWDGNDIGPWNKNYFGTSMGVVCTPKEIILNPYSEALAAPLSIVAGGRKPKSLSTAYRYSTAANARFINRDLAEEEAIASPFWLQVTGGDRAFLEKLVLLKFKLLRDVYWIRTGLAFHVREDKNPIERGLFINHVYSPNNHLSFNHLDCTATRLVGVPREKPVPLPSLDELLREGYDKKHRIK